MPRSPTTYSLPPGTTPQQPNTVIGSAMFNAAMDDIAQTFNTVQPIVYGGTGVNDGKPLDDTFGIKNTADPSKIVTFDISGLTTTTTRTWTAPNKSGTLAMTSDIGASTVPFNLALAASVAGNALTISIKGHDGNDPSAANVVSVPFRSATASSGDVDVLSITAATSLVISSGSTMGFTNATAGRLWIVGFNDAGTFRLGAVNVLSGTSIMALRDGIYSSTAEGGAGGADSAQVIYTGTAVTSKPLTILGYIDWSGGLTTAGTWSIVPTNIQVISSGGALPGEVIQCVRTDTGAVATGSTQVPLDDTIPQSTEGTQFMTQDITPRSSSNILHASTQAAVSSSGGSAFFACSIFRDAISNAQKSSLDFENQAGGAILLFSNVSVLAGSTALTSFKVRVGVNVVSTVTFNGLAGTRYYGGAMNSFIQVEEIMA